MTNTKFQKMLEALRTETDAERLKKTIADGLAGEDKTEWAYRRIERYLEYWMRENELRKRNAARSNNDV